MSSKLGDALAVLALVLVVSSARAQGQVFDRSAFGVREEAKSLIKIAEIEAVQKDIGLADAGKILALAAEYRAAWREEFERNPINFELLRNLPRAERTAKMAEQRDRYQAVVKKLDSQFDPKLKQVLTEEQFKRLGEIKIQATGLAAALADAAVVQELGLKEGQQNEIAEILAEARKARNDLLRRGAATNFQQVGGKLRELNEKTITKATAVLDAGQKDKFMALKGKPFDTTQLEVGRRPPENDN